MTLSLAIFGKDKRELISVKSAACFEIFKNLLKKIDNNVTLLVISLWKKAHTTALKMCKEVNCKVIGLLQLRSREVKIRKQIG